MPAQVYVTHGQPDRAYGEALARHLGAQGVAVWLDPRGEVFDPFVQQAIDAAGAVILVQTTASMSSPTIAHQLQYAAGRGKPLVVLLLDAGAAPPAFATHVVDVRDGRMPGDDTVLWLHQLGQWPASHQPAPAAAPGRRRAFGWILGAAGVVLLLVASGIVTLGWLLGRSTRTLPPGEQDGSIPGLINYLDPSSPDFDETVLSGPHFPGVLTYPMSPPAGGPHNPVWQNCMGDVYPAEIAKEHAVHSLEHGAVWITYDPGLPQDQIDTLASKVDGREFLMMSPYPGLSTPISLQAWGYQLRVEHAGDERIDDFIIAMRQTAAPETGASCSGGITETSSTPFDV